jgi:hypothetical protein
MRLILQISVDIWNQTRFHRPLRQQPASPSHEHSLCLLSLRLLGVCRTPSNRHPERGPALARNSKLIKTSRCRCCCSCLCPSDCHPERSEGPLYWLLPFWLSSFAAPGSPASLLAGVVRRRICFCIQRRERASASLKGTASAVPKTFGRKGLQPLRYVWKSPKSCQAPKPPKPNKTKRKIGAHYSAQLSIIEIELKKKS